jgi:hypothetical protein
VPERGRQPQLAFSNPALTAWSAIPCSYMHPPRKAN